MHLNLHTNQMWINHPRRESGQVQTFWIPTSFKYFFKSFAFMISLDDKIYCQQVVTRLSPDLKMITRSQNIPKRWVASCSVWSLYFIRITTNWNFEGFLILQIGILRHFDHIPRKWTKFEFEKTSIRAHRVWFGYVWRISSTSNVERMFWIRCWQGVRAGCLEERGRLGAQNADTASAAFRWR